MAEKTTDDEALKARIITHMNQDHRKSLSHYLQHYSKLPAAIADTAELVDISLSRITLSMRSPPTDTETRTTYLPIRPSPMQALSESRERLVYMANECLTGLGLSPHVVKAYAPPGIVGVAVMIGVLTGLWSFSSKRNLEEGSFVRMYLLQNYHPLADFLMRVHVFGFIAIILAHIAECLHLQKTRLRKHQVETYSKVWWLWTVNCALEGFGVFGRFDKEVEEVIKAKKKH
ncbi:hypothetical protein L873DRAFT_1831314 [Choiromyces venosus 120613-1]|uniref:DUF2470 domain-containing protein n=1 Tax=Choiromyces venosus 120613-1 TaxID=1336337 RepID=A0A3N4J5W5_9PEZI|nr:hypothetical protein L873DRAFT_1831314 [Choiromyces venosus 120613-1]